VPELIFRRTVEEDAGVFLEAIQTNAEFLAPWVTTPRRVRDFDSARSCVTASLPNGSPERFGAFCGVKLVGSAKFIICDFDVPDYEVGLWCVQEWAHRGVGRWILSNAITTAFADGANRVTLRHAASNAPCGRLMAGLGVTREGAMRAATRIRNTLDEVIIYGVLRNEWPTQNALGWCAPCREF